MLYAIQNTATKAFWVGGNWQTTVSFRGMNTMDRIANYSGLHPTKEQALLHYPKAKESAAERGENCIIVEIKN